MIQKEYIKPEFTVVILKPHYLLQNSVTVKGLDQDYKGYGGDGEETDEAD